MITTLDDTATHPVTAFAARAREVLADVVSPEARPVWSMTADELRRTLLDLAAFESEVSALRLEVLAEAERTEACVAEGDRGAAEWVARQTRQRRPHARADLRLGQSLDDRYLQTRLAMRAGRVNLDQARAITHALDQLPQRGDDAVTVDELALAETFLVDHAAHHDARDLAVLGKRLFEVIAPDEADAREGRALEAEEREAARRVSFSMREDDQGVVHGRFRISRLHGAMLEKALQSLTSPEPDRPLSVRRGEAFGELIERLGVRDLPDLGGGDATVVVTTTLADLLGRLHDAGVATLDTGAKISATEARRLACRHRVVPAVLGGQGEVLDLGRSRRLHSKAQRVAMAVAQGGCTAEHCHVTAALCHAHHDVPWSQGGSTDLATGRLLCPHHHRRVHDPAYDHRVLPDGRVAFHRRE